jgi:hypothetical protein
MANIADIDKPTNRAAVVRVSMLGGLVRTLYVYELDDNKAAEWAKIAIAAIVGETVETVKLLNLHELTGYGMKPGDVNQIL